MRALSFGIVCVIVAHALGALLPWPGPWREAAWLVAAPGLGLGAAVALARLASWRVAAGVAVAGVAAWLGCLRGANTIIRKCNI